MMHASARSGRMRYLRNCLAAVIVLAAAVARAAGDTLPTPGDHATVFIYRGPGSVDTFGAVTISLNGVQYGMLHRRSVLTLNVAPGVIEIGIMAFKRSSLTIMAVGGETYYVSAWQSEGTPPFALPMQARFTLKVVPADVGLRDTADLRLVSATSMDTPKGGVPGDHVAIPQDDGDAARYGDVSWFAGLGELRVSTYATAWKRARHGSLTLTQHKLTFLEQPDSAGASAGIGLQLEYGVIERVEVLSLFATRIAVLHFKDGHTDSFQITRMGASKETEAAAGIVQSRLGTRP